MAKYIFVFLLYMVSIISIIHGEGQNESDVIQKNFAFSNFDSILAKGSFRIRIIQSENWDIHISCLREDFKDIKVKKQSNEFQITMREGKNPGLRTPVVVISMPSLIGLNLSGSVQIEAGGFSSENNLIVLMNPGVFLNLKGFECNKADFTLFGPSELHSFISANDICIISSGSSIVRMGGRAENLLIKSNGRSRIDGSLIIVDRVELQLEGINEIKITPDRELLVNSTDKSVIYYRDKYMEQEVVNSGQAILRKY